MNAPAVRPQVLAGGHVAALIPQSMDEAFRVSQAIAMSGLAPRGIDKAEQIMVAIMAGAELGLAPFQSLQSFAVVNGRPTLWGDGLLAVVRGRGVKVKEWQEGEGDDMVARCLCTRPDTGEEVERAFSVEDAKKAGLWGKTGPWQQYPKRMLQMRARALSLRDGCADMLRGIQVREEVEDYQIVREVAPPQGTGMRARLEARAAAADEQGFDAGHIATTVDLAPAIDVTFTETPAGDPQTAGGEQQDPEVTADTAAPQALPETAELTLDQRADAFEARLKAAASGVKLKSIWAANAKLREDLAAEQPKRLAELLKVLDDRAAALEQAERAG